MSPPTDNPPVSCGLRLLALLALLALPVAGPGAARAADPLRDRVVPFLEAYCVRCHDAAKKSGDLDLAKLASPPRLAESHRYWEHVVGFVRKEEMPPATAKQPTPELRREVLAALEAALKAEASRAAGDPGPVAPRRLTNAEYDYTIRDLTGIDIGPAREFPVDPASGEGFRNTGEALTLSPGLFRKYYAAGEHVADHALLTTQGLRFAPHPVVTFADRQKVAEQAILRFYEAHAVDHEAYLAALWLYRHRPADRKKVTVEAWATGGDEPEVCPPVVGRRRGGRPGPLPAPLAPATLGEAPRAEKPR